MDPYLEHPRYWPGVHDSLIIYIRDLLQPLLRPRYYIEVGERVYFEDRRDVIQPDAVIHAYGRDAGARPAGAMAVIEPDEPVITSVETRQRETFLEVRLLGSDVIVTVLKVIRPANKLGNRGREEYRSKQDEVLGSPAGMVEIDLLRYGRPIVLASPGELDRLGRYDYVACVSRASNRKLLDAYPVTVRQRLPRITVPLEPDSVVLDLPAAFARCYESGGYAERIDYCEPPYEPLRPDDAEWADRLLRQAGLRGDLPRSAPQP
jgi:hypothetical protein